MDMGPMGPIHTGSDWREQVEVVSADDGTPIDLAELGATVELQVRDRNGCIAISGDSISGQVEIYPGFITWGFLTSALGRICPGTYRVHVRVKVGDETDHLFSSDLTVTDGGFR